MADACSHNGDCSRDPPRPPHRILPGSCELAPPSKRRGISRNLNLEKQWLNDGRKKPLYIDFDWKFDIRGGRSDKEYEDIIGSLDRLATDRYRAYKTKANEHFREYGRSCPYGEISVEDWQRCLDLFTSPNFLARSEKNKVIREKARYPSRQGSRSFFATRYSERNPETGEWLSVMDGFERLHRRVDGEWVNENVAVDHDLLVLARKTQHTGTQVDERAIVKEALGERRGHGVGWIPMGRSSSTNNSVASSHVPTGNTHSPEVVNSKDPLELYQAQMQAQMETMMMVIRRLAANQGLSADDMINEERRKNDEARQ